MFRSGASYRRHAAVFGRLLTAAALIAISMVAMAHATASYGQASDILNIGAGARSMGMGSAFTGLADDASAPYFNPAGLAYLDEHQLMAMHAPLMLNSNYNYIASAHPFGDRWGAAAISDVLFLSDHIEARDRNNNVTDSNASVTNNSVFASYAHKLTESGRLSAGVNVKFLQQKVAGFSDGALGLDVGFMYKFAPILSVGAAFANLNSPGVKLQNDRDVYRPINRLGLASQVFRNRLTLTVDAIKVNQESTLYAAGAELSPTNLFDFRAGFNANRSYTFGLGIKIKTFRIDYAFSDTDLGAFNKVSFTWAWHNIYKTDLEPPKEEGRAVFPLSGFENQVAFRTSVPDHVVANWSLSIKNSEGKEVRHLSGDLRPPKLIVWDAKNAVGEPVVGGRYTYTFAVNYKNGKAWTVVGDVNLDLPNRKNEVIDMSLELNGAQATTEEDKK